ncbi:MAG: transporter [Frankiales bacterium]|nr:transporter [Frankiales bacterium]
MSTTVTSSGTPPRARQSGAVGALDRFFHITDRGSTFGRETRGGLTTFFTMAYIVVLNPLIIGLAPDRHGNTLGLTSVAGVTCLVAAAMTILMGVLGRVPFALATGLGLNAFVAVSVASQMSWPEAMGLVVLEGLVITVLVLTGFRTAVFRAIPRDLKAAIAVGIGLFITFIGLVDGGFVRRIPDAAHTTVPVQLGADGSLHGWPTAVFLFGLALTAVLVVRKVKGALLLGIVGTTVVAAIVNALAHPGPAFVGGKPNPGGWSLNVPSVPDKLFGAPDLHLLGHFSLLGAFSSVGVLTALLLVFTLVLADFFDVMGTTVALASEADLLDDAGLLPNTGQVLLVDGLAAVAGGAASASSATTYVESSAGIADGARTGLASVVTGLLFLVALLFTPLVDVVPSEAAGPVLVVVGVLMMSQIRNIDFTDLAVAIPAFLTITLMPLTYSITNGIGIGFVAHTMLKVARGQARQIHALMWGVSLVFVLYFGINLVKAAAGVS